MNIVDIGAGTGQYSYLFAEGLKGLGMVFATDISQEMIGYMNNQVLARKLTNMRPVLVNPEGMDEFYLKYKFPDSIFKCNTSFVSI